MRSWGTSFEKQCDSDFLKQKKNDHENMVFKIKLAYNEKENRSDFKINNTENKFSRFPAGKYEVNRFIRKKLNLKSVYNSSFSGLQENYIKLLGWNLWQGWLSKQHSWCPKEGCGDKYM